MRVWLWLVVLTMLAGCSARQSSLDPVGEDTQAEQEATMQTDVRQAQVAGLFYPDDPEALQRQVDELLSAAQPTVAVESKPRVLVLPHAGYDYSGQVAASGFARLAGYDYDTVIVLTTSHVARVEGVSVYDGQAFATPLGEVPIHRGLVQALIEADARIGFFPAVEPDEHTIEVMLPFLQRQLGFFTLVPITLGAEKWSDAALVGEILPRLLTDNTLVVVSSDLSHYPDHETAQNLDAQTLAAIAGGEAEVFRTTLENLEAEAPESVVTAACGAEAIWAGLRLVEQLGLGEGQILIAANSGDVAIGDKDRVVGYGAVVFGGGDAVGARRAVPLPEPLDGFAGDDVLDPAARAEALALVRATMKAFVQEGVTPDFAPLSADLYRPLGAFVSLKKEGDLRGSIGVFESAEPLWMTLREMAVAAVSQDNRFPPVAPDELDSILATLSVLSPSQRVTGDPREAIELGVHGVTVERGRQRGTFLPQVATETGWDLDQLMGELCAQKAGLSWDCWLDPETAVYTYTAQVFGE